MSEKTVRKHVRKKTGEKMVVTHCEKHSEFFRASLKNAVLGSQAEPFVLSVNH